MPIFIDGKAFENSYDLYQNRAIPVMDDSKFRKSDNIDDRRAQPEEQGPLHPNDLQGGWLPEDNMETAGVSNSLSVAAGEKDISETPPIINWANEKFSEDDPMEALIKKLIVQDLAKNEDSYLKKMEAEAKPQKPLNFSSKQEIHTIQEGPEYNKWDEALQKYGTIRIPKELDNPQEWLSRDQFKDILKDVDRRDEEDGSVVLSIVTPTS